MSNRLLSMLVASAALGFAISPAESKTVIQVMHQGDPDTVSACGAVAKRFEEANPDVDIELIYAPHDAYNEKFSAAVMSKQMPDIVELDAPFLANYVWSGYLQKIKPLIDPGVLDDMTDSNIAQGTYPVDEELYALGLTDSSVVLYGNKKYLEAIGARIPKSVDDAWTREEFEGYLEKLSNLEDVKWPIDTFRGYGIKTEWITYAYSPILQSPGCDLIDRKTWKSVGTLDSEPCVDALRLMQTWVKNGWVVPQSSGTNQFYAEGHPAALALGGHWVYAEAAASMKDDIVVMPLPKFGPKGASPNGTWIWAITTASQQVSKTAIARPPHPAYPMITSTFMQAVDEIFNGGDVKTALTAAAENIDEDVEDNDGYPPFDEQQ